MKKDLVQNLGSTRKRFGPIYPVIMTEDGEVIDGLHRQQAGWEDIKKLPIKGEDRKDVIALRFNLNVVRRNPSKEEKSALVNELAEILLKSGVEQKDIVKAIAAELGHYSTRWFYRYLDRKYKMITRPMKGEIDSPTISTSPPYRHMHICIDNEIARQIDQLTIKKKFNDFTETLHWLIKEALSIISMKDNPGKVIVTEKFGRHIALLKKKKEESK